MQLLKLKKMTAKCNIYCEFYKHQSAHFNKATQPFERISADFKGPLPSVNTNKHILTMIDEHYRFLFSFPFAVISLSTVIQFALSFSLSLKCFSFVHSDRSLCSVYSELKQFVHNKGIATSRTTAYNPQGNGLAERLNSPVEIWHFLVEA